MHGLIYGIGGVGIACSVLIAAGAVIGFAGPGWPLAAQAAIATFIGSSILLALGRGLELLERIAEAVAPRPASAPLAAEWEDYGMPPPGKPRP